MENTASSMVADLVTESVDTISPDESVTVARRRMESQTSRSLIVVEGDRPVGIVQWRSLARLTGDTSVRDVMLTEVPVLRSNMSVDAVRDEWANMDVDLDHLPVVDANGALIGEVARGAITKSETTTTAATQPVVAGPEADRDVPTVRLEQGMTVNGASGKKLGTVDEVELNAEGNISHFTVKYGMLGRNSKRLPADVIDTVDGGEVRLNLDQVEFKMLADVGDDLV
jgi:CBS domain-containing protein/sporulation protein YlmC with PRC-barrel domain